MKAWIRCFFVMVAEVTVLSLGLSQAGAQTTGAPQDGDALLKAGKLVEACEAFEAVLTRDPGNVAAQDGEVAASERLAVNERAAGHRDDALKALLQAQEYVPDDKKLLYDLGILEDEMRLFVDADRTLTHLESLGALGSLEPETLYAMARVKLDVGQLGAAEEKMVAYLKLRPQDASAHYGLGRVYRQGLQFDKACAEFERSIELQPRQTEGYYELGDAELAQGKYAEAMVNLTRTLERNSKHGGALTDEGIVYFKQKQYEKAITTLQQAIAAAPEYQPSHYYLGLTLARLGRAEDSKRELDIATQMAERDHKLAAGLRLQGQTP